MGVDGLWTVLRPASVVRSYAEVFVKEAFADGRPLRVGVDAEGVMRAAQAVFNKRGHVQHGMNPELWALTCLMCRFARQPAVFVFIFDGPSKVRVKRGTRVFNQPIWLVEYFKQMIDSFGFHHRDAAGEGEVELCHLQKVGALDVIFTEDSDVWVYGATQVIRRLPSNSSLNELAVYSSARIRQMLDLSQPGFLLFALLSGGDYDQGIQGIGPTVAYALARTSLGDELLRLVKKGRAYYVAHVASWRSDLVEELVTNRSGHLRKRERAVAAKIPDDFPRVDLVWQYVYPTTSVVDARNYIFEPRKLDLHRILRLCQLWFGLQTCADMYKRCLPIAQAYYNKQLFGIASDDGSLDSPRITKIKDSGLVPLVSMEVDSDAFSGSVLLLTEALDAAASQNTSSLHFNVPLPVVEARLPQLLHQFYGTSAGKRYIAKRAELPSYTKSLLWEPSGSPAKNATVHAARPSVEVIDLTVDDSKEVHDMESMNSMYIEISDDED